MAEIEVPTEHLHETIHEEAHGHGHSHGPEKRDPWIMQVALSSAILAVLAALAALFAGHHVNEAVLERIMASDRWSYFQAKGIKASVLSSKLELLDTLGKEVKEEEREKLSEYKKEQKEIEADAREREEASEHHLKAHNTLASSVTLFQVAIALAAISVLTKKRVLWVVGLVLGLGGTFAFVRGLM